MVPKHENYYIPVQLTDKERQENFEKAKERRIRFAREALKDALLAATRAEHRLYLAMTEKAFHPRKKS